MNKKIAILFLIFTREENSIKSFKSIQHYKPEKLYIAADGPRKNKIGEDVLCKKTREAILNRIDWDCEIYTLFREENLGCAEAVYSAISWFFENEEYGIIIEDDIIVSKDFYLLCEQLLPLHKENQEIMQISAQNRSMKYQSSNKYSFHKMPIIWGWATWRRAWNKMDMTMSAWPSYPKRKLFHDYGIFQGIMMLHYWNYAHKHIHTIQSWATRWFFAVANNDGICICPLVNLAINIGIGDENATHYKKGDKDPYSDLKIGNILWPLEIATKIEPDKKQLHYERSDFFRIRMIGLQKKIKKMIHL